MGAEKTSDERDAWYRGVLARGTDEYARLHIQHNLHKDAMGGKLVQVPVSREVPIRVLDSATGDGRWMLEAAEELPQATFLGTDVAQQHFEQIKELPNDRISFRYQDVLDAWPAEDQHAYDLVHQRFCYASFTREQSQDVTERLWQLVKPGGWIQLVDGDLLAFDVGPEYPGMDSMVKFIDKAFTEGGKNPSPGAGMKTWLQQSGAQNVEERVLDFGIGKRADSPGKQELTMKNITGMIDMYEMIASKHPNYWFSKQDFANLRSTMKDELSSKGNVWRFYIVTAQRPK